MNYSFHVLTYLDPIHFKHILAMQVNIISVLLKLGWWAY